MCHNACCKQRIMALFLYNGNHRFCLWFKKLKRWRETPFDKISEDAQDQLKENVYFRNLFWELSVIFTYNYDFSIPIYVWVWYSSKQQQNIEFEGAKTIQSRKSESDYSFSLRFAKSIRFIQAEDRLVLGGDLKHYLMADDIEWISSSWWLSMAAMKA